MKYHLNDTFNQTIQSVTNAFINFDQMKQWQTHLVGMESISGVWPETGFVGYLIYDVTGIKSKMKVTIKENQLPHKLVLIYEVPGVLNQCDYYFESKRNQTLYHMDVAFEFADQIERPLDLFKAETTRVMHFFKSYIEGI